MNSSHTFRRGIPALVLVLVAFVGSVHTLAQRQRTTRGQDPLAPGLTQVLGRPADRSITLSVLSSVDVEALVEFGTKAGEYARKTDIAKAGAGVPLEIGITGLQPNTRYYYRLRDRRPGETPFREGRPGSFHAQRAAGSSRPRTRRLPQRRGGTGRGDRCSARLLRVDVGRCAVCRDRPALAFTRAEGHDLLPRARPPLRPREGRWRRLSGGAKPGGQHVHGLQRGRVRSGQHQPARREL